MHKWCSQRQCNKPNWKKKTQEINTLKKEQGERTGNYYAVYRTSKHSALATIAIADPQKSNI